MRRIFSLLLILALISVSVVAQTRKKLPAQNEFRVGINYPWHNCGWDFGRSPWNKEPIAHDGLSKHRSDLTREFRELRNHGISLIRIFVFHDLRTGVIYNSAGLALRFDGLVTTDMLALLQLARQEHIQLILVLLDFGIADGHIIADKFGEHPRLVRDKRAGQAFINRCLRPLFKNVLRHYQDVIYAIEPMNEPENTWGLKRKNDHKKLYRFLANIAQLSHEIMPAVPVTLGSWNRGQLVKHWMHFPADILQYHFYKPDHLKRGLPFDYPAHKISSTKPIILGEVESDYNLYNYITLAKKNGYRAILFWAYHAFDGSHVDLATIKRWLNENEQ
jgi:hypothetical protein